MITWKVVVIFCAVNAGIEDGNNCIQVPRIEELYQDKAECDERATNLFADVYNNEALRASVLLNLDFPEQLSYYYGCIDKKKESS